jgi:hypothetical protein
MRKTAIKSTAVAVTVTGGSPTYDREVKLSIWDGLWKRDCREDVDGIQTLFLAF